jgi:hypothetical protein
MDNLDKDIKRIENNSAWDESDEVVDLEVKKPLDKVIPVRLPASTWEKLRHEAKELGIGPTTLARMWIIERLKIQSTSHQDLSSLIELLKQNPSLQKTVISEKRKPYEID